MPFVCQSPFFRAEGQGCQVCYVAADNSGFDEGVLDNVQVVHESVFKGMDAEKYFNIAIGDPDFSQTNR